MNTIGRITVNVIVTIGFAILLTFIALAYTSPETLAAVICEVAGEESDVKTITCDAAAK